MDVDERTGVFRMNRSHGSSVHGLDNNQRAVFFGPQGDTRRNQARLAREISATINLKP